MFLHDAIRSIYSNVVTINGNTQNTIVAKDANDNVINITDWDAVNTKATELQTAENNKEQSKIDLKASAKTKLMNGEALTEDEANVMVGL
jgi:hypothetical protein